MYDLKEMKYMNIVHKRWLWMLLGNKDLVLHNSSTEWRRYWNRYIGLTIIKTAEGGNVNYHIVYLQKMNWGKIPRNFFFFFKDEGNLHKREHGRNITDDRGYDADSDTTTVTSGTIKIHKTMNLWLI